MKITKINILGEDRPLGYSVQVACDAEEKFGDAGGIFKLMKEAPLKAKMDGLFWLLEAMLKAGKDYARLIDEYSPEPLTREELMQLYGLEDVGELTRSVMDAVTAGVRREVEAEPPKNSEAAPET